MYSAGDLDTEIFKESYAAEVSMFALISNSSHRRDQS